LGHPDHPDRKGRLTCWSTEHGSPNGTRIEVEGQAVWKTPADESPAPITAARARRKEKDAEERLRLLYVAMTRARSWLIVCGAGEVKQDQSWYRLVQAGMAAAAAEALPGGRLRHAFGTWPDPQEHIFAPVAPVSLPVWATTPAAEPLRAPRLLTPSDLGGAKALPGDGLDEDAAKARGTALHLLMEHLPSADPADWPGLAASLVADPTLRADLLAEVTDVLTSPALRPIFAATDCLIFTEVALTSDLLGRRMVGTVDRLLVWPDRVLAIDFKSNRMVPASAQETPDGLLRQMGAYAHALAHIYPGRRIDTAILWTRSAELMQLDPDIVSAALARTTIP